ncbi:MAG: hypothetical protein ABFS56_22040 [Pseudomonadota bacterium]
MDYDSVKSLFEKPGITGSFACGHGKNAEVKRPYIRNILRVLRDYEDELKGE